MMRTMRIQPNGALSLRISAIFAKLRRPVCILAMLFLFMRAEPVSGNAPFAAAFFAAGLFSGENVGAMAAGCILGALRFPLLEAAVLPAIACACIMAGEIAFSTLKFLKKIDGHTRISILAGFGVLLPSLIFAGGEILPSLQGLACAALAAAASPFLAAALGVKANRKWYLAEERVGALLMAGGALCGMYAVSPIVAEIAAGLGVMCMPGAGMGVVCGLFLALGGAPAVKIAHLALCGLAAGVHAGSNRKFCALRVCACGVLAQILLEAGTFSWFAMPVAAVLYLLTPQAWQDAIAHFLRPVHAAEDPDRISQLVAMENQRRLRALGDAFGDMAESYAEPTEVPDEQALICAMRERLCSGCSDYPHCWAGRQNRAARFLCSLITDAISLADAPSGRRVLFSDGEIPPDILRICRRGRMIPDRLGFLLRDFAERRRAEIKRADNNRLVSVQFLQAREILYDLAQRQAAPMHFQGGKIDRARAALDSIGLKDVTIGIRGGGEIGVTRSDEHWTREEVLRAGTEINRIFGGRYVPERLGSMLRFTRYPRLAAQTGVACQSGVAGEACGDSHILRMMDDGRMLALICDGMGMGEAAAQESRTAIHLLWRFLNAEISRPLAIEAVNRQMLMQSGEEMFATMDLCLIDLNSGVAELSKLAASRTILLRGNELRAIEGAHLPLGILEGIQTPVQRIRLRPGDVLIMGSDGVMEAGDGRMIERIVRAGSGMQAQQLAEQIVREAALRRSHGRADDMSCICIRIEKPDERRRDAPFIRQA